jgi:glycosyltransferase involved in cell wall biosynthesis
MIQTSSQETPMISIIIPVRNEENHIAHLLDTLLEQECPPPFEIIVVDGLSTDRTVEIVQEYSESDPRIHYLSNPRQIAPAALNIGINASSGEIILRLDGHWLTGSRDYLAKIVAAFRRFPEADCLGGRSERKTDGEKGKLIELARSSLLGGGISLRNYSMEEGIINQENIAYIWTRRVFDRVGLFDERFIRNQDNEFNLRTLEAGFKTLYSPEIIFIYHVPATYKKLYRQLFGFAAYIPMMIIKHHRMMHLSYIVPPIGLMVWLLLCVLALSAWISVIYPIVLTILYLLVLSVGALMVCIRHQKNGFTSWYSTFMTFMIIHVAVSAGYFYGLLKLVNFLWIEESLAKNTIVQDN